MVATRKLFSAVVVVLGIGLFLLITVIVGPHLLGLALYGSGSSGIGSFAFGISWSLLRTIVIVATVVVIGILVLLWTKVFKD